MSHHLVEVRDLHYRYPDGHCALSGVGFRITHGEAVAIVGANGAGKSTLLQHLNGTLVPQGGEVRIGEIPLTRRTLPAVRRTVGMIFQDPDDQLFMPSVIEDVCFGPLNLGLSGEEALRRGEEALAQVGVPHLRDRSPQRLSGGEKRTVALATVLAMNPDVLVLDEPTAGLDPFARRQLIERLKSFIHTRIVATHDLDLVLDLCPRTIVLHEGRIVADGPTDVVFADAELLRRSRLEQPFRMQGCPACGDNRKTNSDRPRPDGSKVVKLTP